MKIFLDTADCKVIQKHVGTGLIDGVTTNPSLILKSHRKPDDVYQELKSMGLRDISMEVVADSVIETLREAHRLVEIFGDVTTIKVPCTPDGLQACHELAKESIRVNVTLVFSQAQAILAAKAGAMYVSPFVGRVDDNSFGGLCLVKDIAKVFREHMVRTQVLAASLRGVRDVGRAFEYGADIVTMPPGVFEGMYNHILTDKGLEMFNHDWKTAQDLTNENKSLVQ
jgi:transaldolase